MAAMSNDQPQPSGKAGGLAPLQEGWDYDEEERLYAEWLHRFVERLSRRLPDEPAHFILAAADSWAHHFDQIEPEEAAEIAAMWWDQHRALP
jgi:hypothetical protein